VTSPDRIPITVLTGFLGSGKTTLLNHLLSQPDMQDSAVLINEFGEVGLDHLLVAHVNENMVLLDSGCLCCTVRSDLIDSLNELAARRLQGAIPAFKRVLVETTGLADPAAILHTLISDPDVIGSYRLHSVVTTVDAQFGGKNLDEHREAVKQAAVADRLLITKTDLVERGALEDLAQRLKILNPTAPIMEIRHGGIAPRALLDTDFYDLQKKLPEVANWLTDEAHRDDHPHPDVNRHDAHIRSVCLTLDDPLPWQAVHAAITMMTAFRGEHMLRVKGIVHVAETGRPRILHGVQHILYPPVDLPAWPSEDRRTHLIFILRDLDTRFVEQTFRNLVGENWKKVGRRST
jgi:G3E family GTPase